MIKKAIGLVSPIQAGMWIITDFLKDQDYIYYSLADRVREEALRRGLENNRKAWQKIGDDLRKQFGNDYLASKTLEAINEGNSEIVVIDSIRHPRELNYLKQQLGLKVTFVGINAPVEVRYKLMIDRKRGVDPLDFQQFKILDDNEINNDSDNGQNINKTLSEVDILFEHLGDLDALRQEVEQKLSKLVR